MKLEQRENWSAGEHEEDHKEKRIQKIMNAEQKNTAPCIESKTVMVDGDYFFWSR